MDFAKIITVDFSKKEGKIRALTGLNFSPVISDLGKHFDISSDFADMSVPLVRVSDTESPYGKNQYVDVHCIFPDFTADEALPESYNFTETDKYLSKIKDAGADVIFRLGESLDPYERKLFVKRPADVSKWARICEHIILHYNEGFAGGYKWRIKHWEIWNLPEIPDGFQGDGEEFFSLYTEVSIYLKERFPKLKIGGYGSLGFSGLNRLNAEEIYKSAPAYAERFLAYVKEKHAPLDFFSWYCYADTPEEIALHARYARNALDGAGFKRTASYIVGFNLTSAEKGAYRGYSSDLLASLITAQKSGVDIMVYDGAQSALYSFSDGKAVFTSAKSAFSAFGRLWRLGTAVESLGDARRELYSLAARSASAGAVIVVSQEYSGKLELRLKNADFSSFSVSRYYEDDSGAPRLRTKEGISLSGNKIAVTLERGDVYLLEFVN